jgi:Tol biopolymer transport system component
MSRRWGPRLHRAVSTTATLVVMAVLALVAGLGLAACSGSGTKAATDAGTAAATAAAGQNEMPLPAPTVAGTLAFARVTSAHDGAYVIRTGDICVVRTDGTELTPLAAGPAEEAQPAWAPDGRQIAYAVCRLAGDHRATVRVMNADGSGQRRLLRSPLASQWPAWSPDGTQVAFFQAPREIRGWLAGWSGLVVVDAAGEGPLSRPTGGDVATGDRFAAWAPDGRIFFLRSRLGDVFSVRHDGSALTRVTTGGGHGAFALSPDGTQLALYDREHDHLVVQPTCGGGTPVVLVDDMSRYVPSESVRQTWSPDGAAIAFAASSDRTRTPYSRGSALYVVNTDGSGLSVVPDTGKVWDPAWRPE